MAKLSPQPDYEALKETCNLWRNWDDIDDSWQSWLSIADYFSTNQDTIAQHAGPGHWNDPGESNDECRSSK